LRFFAARIRLALINPENVDHDRLIREIRAIRGSIPLPGQPSTISHSMNPPLHYSTPPARPPTDLCNLRKAINASLGWHRHPRNGKVARLPEHLRNRLNLMLQEGIPYRDVIAKLQQAGCLPYPLSEMNLSNWYRGGFRDWLRDQSKAAVGLPPQFDVTRPVFQQAAALKALCAQPSQPQALPVPPLVSGGPAEMRLTSANPAH
jgi:hypothetical protein